MQYLVLLQSLLTEISYHFDAIEIYVGYQCGIANKYTNSTPRIPLLYCLYAPFSFVWIFCVILSAGNLIRDLEFLGRTI